MSFNDLAVVLAPQSHLKKYFEVISLEHILDSKFWTKEMLITRRILIAAKFSLQNRHCHLILHKKCQYLSFPKVELSKKFSLGLSVVKMQKTADFSCLGNQQLRCAGSVVCSYLALFLHRLIRAVISSVIQLPGSRCWSAAPSRKIP